MEHPDLYGKDTFRRRRIITQNAPSGIAVTPTGENAMVRVKDRVVSVPNSVSTSNQEKNEAADNVSRFSLGLVE
jgi:hypothetical protein